MWRSFRKRMTVVAAVASAVAMAVSAETAAAQVHLEFAPGEACTFGLAVTGTGGNQQVHTFVDANGKTVRILSAGVGFQTTFTNLSSNATFGLPANGSVTNIVFNADGSQTVTLIGHNVLFLFPSDVPAGPSTTLHVGRVVFTIDPAGVFTVVSVSGTETDLCDALS